ncbi:MAG: HD domain-containing protein [Treponema sp.]|nr:HD domain-containing protein [Treponema sp.]
MKNKIKVPSLLLEFYEQFANAGFTAYLVGGAVRDIFLKKEASDWDVATNATPQDVMKIFKFVVPTGIEHGTVTVHFKKAEIEVTTFRTESGYSDGRHPDSVNYAATIEEDLARRDFTMNAIAVNLEDGTIVDPFEGRKDIKAKIIRTVGAAHDRFMEDGLRPVRAIRFASKLNFSIENQTYSELFKEDIHKKISSVSMERFRDEFIKILQSEKPSVGLKLMEESGILALFIPEFSKCRNCIQSDYRAFHDFDVLDHLFYACDGAPKEKLNVRLAALFHDIGKTDSKEIKIQNVIDGNKKDGSKKEIEAITFYNHEIIGSEITEKILTNLKFPNAMINDVCHLIRLHMFHYESNWSDGAVRRFIVRAKAESLEDLFDLRLADIYGMHNAPVRLHDSIVGGNLLELKDRISNLMQKQQALSMKDLAVNGKDLINEGIPAGKKMGIILNKLFDCVLEDPSLNTKEKLIEIAKKI